MGKSLRSKVKRRWRALKRKVVETSVKPAELAEISHKLRATAQGLEYREKKPANAFKYPNDPCAQFH